MTTPVEAGQRAKAGRLRPFARLRPFTVDGQPPTAKLVYDLEFYDRRIQGIIEDVLQQWDGHPPFTAAVESAPTAEFAQAADFALAAEFAQAADFAQAAEFAAVLRQCVGDPPGPLQSSERPLPWPYLPILCCQAVRGDPGQDTEAVGGLTGVGGQTPPVCPPTPAFTATDRPASVVTDGLEAAIIVAAALELARLAAQVLDEVEDGDAGTGVGGLTGVVCPPPPVHPHVLWLSSGVPQAVNAGTGLIFASLLALARLYDCGVVPEIVADLQAEFVRTGFRMCQGQHLDLIAEAQDNLSLEGYWQIAEAKTCAFLELGCRAGALLGGAAGAYPERLNSATAVEHAGGVHRRRRGEIATYAEYGRHLGFLVQIVNDLGGLLDEEGSDLVRHKKTLPLIYALSVAGEGEKERLRRAWAEAAYDAGACREVRRLVIELGALQYTFVQGELHHRRALSAIQGARGDPGALAGLTALLDQYRPASLLA